jgi:hypothetical protein
VDHPAKKSFIYETSELSETDGYRVLKPRNTNGFGFVGVSLVSDALILAKKGEGI